jgi:hypothetical protein
MLRWNYEEAAWRHDASVDLAPCGRSEDPQAPGETRPRRQRFALGKIRGATTIDAIVAAFAVQRTGIVYTADVDDFRALGAFFPALRVFAI